ncbi:DUF6339 family protein [Peribacillus frigoritolerans]|uniref:DUF6339 family protein n=1 Tax=Peribacillus frigoritolerans TaxID=450367 RepID=UPI0039A3353A
MTYNKSRVNPFELIHYLFQVIDFVRQFGERAYSRNPKLVKAVFSILKGDLQFYPKDNRDAYRVRYLSTTDLIVHRLPQ